MFDEKFISDYKSIKAPDGLFDKIMNNSRPPEKSNIKTYLRTAAGIAAVLTVTLISAFALRGSNDMPGIFIGDEPLTGEIALTSANTEGIMLARAVNELCVDFSFEEKDEVSLTPEKGFIRSSEGEILCEENTSSVIGTASDLQWIIPFPEEDCVYTLNIAQKNSTYTLTLSFDRQTGNWSVSLNK